MGEYEPITKELREQMAHTTMAGKPMVEMGRTVFDSHCDNIDAIHRSLEGEYGRLYETKSPLGPLDADGVLICVGDMLAEGEASPQKVKSLMLDCDGWSVNFGLGWCCVKYHKWHHVKPDTWESIIEDAIGLGGDGCYSNIDTDRLIVRCKALCERTREGE